MSSKEHTASMNLPSEVTGEGPPLVLVPGGLTGWLSWEPMAERLAATRTVVRVQLLAVQSGLDHQALPVGYSLRTESAALARTLETLRLAPPLDVVAWSYGAAVALDLALDHVRWVRTLTLIEPPAYWVLPDLGADAEHIRDQDMLVSRDHITEDDLERFLLRSGLVAPGTNPRDLPRWPTWSHHRQSLRMLPAVWEHEADRGRLSELTRPTLLVKGTGSQPLEHRVVDELAERLPNAQTAEWPGGHAPHLVSTEPFLERMSSFQQQVESESARRAP